MIKYIENKNEITILKNPQKYSYFFARKNLLQKIVIINYIANICDN